MEDIAEGKRQRNIKTPKELSIATNELCAKSFPRRRLPKHGKKPVYWWTTNISEKRKICIRARRVLTRAKQANPNDSIIQDAKTTYKAAKKELRNSIRMRKREMWKELCQNLDEDIWGQAYKIVEKK